MECSVDSTSDWAVFRETPPLAITSFAPRDARDSPTEGFRVRYFATKTTTSRSSTTMTGVNDFSPKSAEPVVVMMTTATRICVFLSWDYQSCPTSRRRRPPPVPSRNPRGARGGGTSASRSAASPLADRLSTRQRIPPPPPSPSPNPPHPAPHPRRAALRPCFDRPPTPLQLAPEAPKAASEVPKEISSVLPWPRPPAETKSTRGLHGVRFPGDGATGGWYGCGAVVGGDVLSKLGAVSPTARRRHHEVQPRRHDRVA